MKRIISLILTAALLIAALAFPASAAPVSGLEAAQTLSALGLMQGTGNGFELERGATRAEALVMLLRLLGEEQAALRETEACPFDDGGWAAPQITYAWKNGLVRGQSETHFGSEDSIGARDWLTMLLRALGYSDADGDFTWERSIAFSDSIGLTHGEYSVAGSFLREDLALVSCNALTMPLSGGELKLAEKLYLDGVVSGASLRAVGMGAAIPGSSEKPEYTGVEIHERFAPAVFQMEGYDSAETLEKSRPDMKGSGFFITADGVAVVCYHEIDDKVAAYALTLDGRRYEITEVIAYDMLWDYAVVRVSRTDLDGNTVSHFPYLELGDSDALRTGEKVYLIASPLGFEDNFTEGVISNRSRNVEDPDYLCLQHSAAAAVGSSGGPLLNSHGEVVGVHFANLVNGENMNLAVPVNVMSDIRLTDRGESVAQVKETVDAQKAVTQLTVNCEDLELVYGDEFEVTVSHDAPFPGGVILRYEIESVSLTGPVACQWGHFLTKRSLTLTVNAIENGTANITIYLGNDLTEDICSKVIHVTVTGAPEETEASETQSSEEEPASETD